MGGRVAHNGEARVGCGLGRLVWQPTSVCQPTGRGADREREVSGYDSDLGDLCVWAMSNSGPAVRLCSEGVLNENSTRKGIYAKNCATSMV